MNTISDRNQSLKNTAITTAAIVAGWEGETYLRKATRYPLGKYIISNLKSVQGGGYKPYVETALEQNNLKDKLKIIDLNKNNSDKVFKELKLDSLKETRKLKFIKHVLRLPSNKNSFDRTLKGQNAFFSSEANAVVCNFDKFGAPVFHEIQHKLNNISPNILVKSLSKLRHPLAILGTLVISTTSLLTNKKNNNEKKHLNDKIKNNCGILTFICMLPLTIEEFIANIKGTTIAKNAKVTGEMLEKVKRIHRLSIFSYGVSAILISLSAWGGNKIRDKICEYKK